MVPNHACSLYTTFRCSLGRAPICIGARPKTDAEGWRPRPDITLCSSQGTVARRSEHCAHLEGVEPSAVAFGERGITTDSGACRSVLRPCRCKVSYHMILRMYRGFCEVVVYVPPEGLEPSCSAYGYPGRSRDRYGGVLSTLLFSPALDPFPIALAAESLRVYSVLARGAVASGVAPLAVLAACRRLEMLRIHASTVLVGLASLAVSRVACVVQVESVWYLANEALVDEAVRHLLHPVVLEAGSAVAVRLRRSLPEPAPVFVNEYFRF